MGAMSELHAEAMKCATCGIVLWHEGHCPKCVEKFTTPRKRIPNSLIFALAMLAGVIVGRII